MSISSRTDCPQYTVYEGGVLACRVSSLQPYALQLQQMVSFYLGCSFSFERSLQAAGVPVRNIQQHRNVSMYRVSVTRSRYTFIHPMEGATCRLNSITLILCLKSKVNQISFVCVSL